MYRYLGAFGKRLAGLECNLSNSLVTTCSQLRMLSLHGGKNSMTGNQDKQIHGAIKEVFRKDGGIEMALSSVASALPDEVIDEMDTGLKAFVQNFPNIYVLKQTSDGRIMIQMKPQVSRGLHCVAPPPLAPAAPPPLDATSSAKIETDDAEVDNSSPFPTLLPLNQGTNKELYQAILKLGHVLQTLESSSTTLSCAANNTSAPNIDIKNVTQALSRLRKIQCSLEWNKAEIEAYIESIKAILSLFLLSPSESLKGAVNFTAVPQNWNDFCQGTSNEVKIMRNNHITLQLLKEPASIAADDSFFHPRFHTFYVSVNNCFTLPVDEEPSDSHLVNDYDCFRVARFVSAETFTPLSELAAKTPDVTSCDMMHILLSAPKIFEFDRQPTTEYGVSDLDDTLLVSGVRFKLDPALTPSKLLQEYKSLESLKAHMMLLRSQRNTSTQSKKAGIRRQFWATQRAISVKQYGKLSTADPRVFAHYLYDNLPDHHIRVTDIYSQLFSPSNNKEGDRLASQIIGTSTRLLRAFPNLFHIWEIGGGNFFILRKDLALPDEVALQENKEISEKELITLVQCVVEGSVGTQKGAQLLELASHFPEIPIQDYRHYTHFGSITRSFPGKVKSELRKYGGLKSFCESRKDHFHVVSKHIRSRNEDDQVHIMLVRVTGRF